MSRASPGPRGGLSQPTSGPLHGIFTIATAVALAGAVLAGVLVWLHLKIAQDSGYTSFCNINSRINCDLVLSSQFSKLFGVPVAWLAFVVYANSLAGEFAFDDNGVIAENAALHDINNLGKLVVSPYWPGFERENALYRP